jgi:DNA topoisomerase-1
MLSPCWASRDRCKRNEVLMEKIFNKSLLSKFALAMDVEPQFRF